MPIPLTGPISLRNNIRAEYRGLQDNLNSYYRGGLYVPDIPTTSKIPSIVKFGETIRFSDFRGTELQHVVNVNLVTGNNNMYGKFPDYQGVNLTPLIQAAGWRADESVPHIITINIAPNVVVTSLNSDTWAMTLAADVYPSRPDVPMSITINNYGYIMGRGGNGSQGAPANYGGIASNSTPGGAGFRILGKGSNVTINVNNYGLIGSGGGGGGGGGSWKRGSGGGGGGGRPYGFQGWTDRGLNSGQTYFMNSDGANLYTGWMARDGHFFPKPGMDSSYFHDWWAEIPVNRRPPAGAQYGTEQYPIPRVWSPHGSAMNYGKVFPQPTAYRGTALSPAVVSWVPYDMAPYTGGRGGDCGEAGIIGQGGTDNSQPNAGAAAGSYAILGKNYINNFNNQGQVLGVQGN